VSTTVKALAGYDPAAVEASVEAAIAAYLSPAGWGIPANDPLGWETDTIVRRFELISLVDRAAGVDYVTALTLAKGADALGTADVTLDGAFALPQAGAINATVT
jgi:hypothetical protein